MIQLALGALTTAASFLFVLGLVVTVHEYGHYLAARLCGVAIDRFSIGFGRALVSWHDKRGVEWRIGWIPLGGYVKFSGDENAASVPDQDDLETMRQSILAREGPIGLRRYFHFKPVWQRAIVTAAGPAANFILAAVLFAVLLGTFGQRFVEPRIGTVAPGGLAAKAGFVSGDLVRAVNGRKINEFGDMGQIIALSPGKALTFTAERAGRTIELVAVPELAASEQDTSVKLGRLDLHPFIEPRVFAVVPGGPADRAGIRVGDLVKSINDRPIGEFEDVVRIVSASPGKSLKVTVERGGRPVDLTAVPDIRTSAQDPNLKVGRLGLLSGEGALRTYNPAQALAAGVVKTGDTLSDTVYFLGRMVTGHVSATNISGVVGIAHASGAVAKAGAEGAPDRGAALFGGMVALLGLAAFMSVSIGFMNLLPVPVLDGGHLLFYAYEALARRPVGARVQAAGYRLGLALLLGLMVFATWNDLQRLSVFKFLGGLFS